MRHTFVDPIPQYAPQALDLYRHVQPSIVTTGGSGFESTFGKRKGKLGTQAQKYRADLIKQSHDMLDMVMEDESLYRNKQQYYQPFDRAMQPQANVDTPPTAPGTIYEGVDDTTMTEERSGGNILTGEVDQIDMGLDNIDMTNEMALEGGSQLGLVPVEQGLVKHQTPIHILPYYGNAVGRRGSAQSVVSQQSTISSSIPTVTEPDSDDERMPSSRGSIGSLGVSRLKLTGQEKRPLMLEDDPKRPKMLRAPDQSDRPPRPPKPVKAKYRPEVPPKDIAMELRKAYNDEIRLYNTTNRISSRRSTNSDQQSEGQMKRRQKRFLKRQDKSGKKS
jgi:hypothetical protein